MALGKPGIGGKLLYAFETKNVTEKTQCQQRRPQSLRGFTQLFHCMTYKNHLM